MPALYDSVWRLPSGATPRGSLYTSEAATAGEDAGVV